MALTFSLPYRSLAPTSPRYSMVDAWRGLASLGVVFDHLGFNSGFNLGHACVMMFFVISGYCIAGATDSCRRNQVGFSSYMWRRIRRIYPPYFFALCLFTATRIVKLRAGMGNQLSPSIVAWIQNLTMTQWLSLVGHPTSFAHQNMTLFVAGFWSLNYEEQFYLLMGLIMILPVFAKRAMIGPILLLMIPAFIWNLYHPSQSYGFFLEYWIAFSLGTLVFYRLCLAAVMYEKAAIDIGLITFLLYSIHQNSALHFGQRSVYFEWVVVSGFSILLIHLRPLDNKFKASILGSTLSAFGLISYSLYLTHQTNFHSSEAVARTFIHLGLPQWSEFAVRAAVMCLVATVFWYFCERPFLNKPLARDSSKGRIP